ncbi:MAG TPA: universal stress protein [Trueperaceae bacterium]|nr:universal stress protein [Trueperaceae bacterium]
MFRHLLLPLTGGRSDAIAIGHARAIALKSEADIRIIQVLELPEQGAAAYPVDPVEWHALRLEAEAYLERVSRELKDAGLQVDCSVLEGQSSEHIIHHAHQGADLMVLPASVFGRSQIGALGGQALWRSYISTLLVRGEAAPKETELGAANPSTRPADRVVPEADAWDADDAEEPAAALPAVLDPNGLYAMVLVPLDGSKRAECVLPAVRFLTEKFGSRIVLAHVVEEPALPRSLPPTAEELELVQRLVAVNLAAATTYLDDVKSRVGEAAEVRLVTGRGTASALHALVEEYAPDLLIMSAHGYGGDQTWPFGEVTTNLIGYSRTPLLLIHDRPWNERTAAPSDVTDEAWGR